MIFNTVVVANNMLCYHANDDHVEHDFHRNVYFYKTARTWLIISFSVLC